MPIVRRKSYAIVPGNSADIVLGDWKATTIAVKLIYHCNPGSASAGVNTVYIGSMLILLNDKTIR